jgi:hypothetical protein
LIPGSRPIAPGRSVSYPADPPARADVAPSNLGVSRCRRDTLALRTTFAFRRIVDSQLENLLATVLESIRDGAVEADVVFPPNGMAGVLSADRQTPVMNATG